MMKAKHVRTRLTGEYEKGFECRRDLCVIVAVFDPGKAKERVNNKQDRSLFFDYSTNLLQRINRSASCEDINVFLSGCFHVREVFLNFRPLLFQREVNDRALLRRAVEECFATRHRQGEVA